MNKADHNLVIEPTKNGFGYMHNKSIIMDKFVAFSKLSSQPVLDIGSAYGVASIKAVENGAKVIACDIDQVHLDMLIDRTPQIQRNNMKTLAARFPNETNFEDGSIGAVLLSHILTFLEGDEIDEGFKKINHWLNENGKVFILNYTPYHSTLTSFIPVYEKNKLSGMRWPGYLSDKRFFKASSKEKDFVPNKINLLDVDILERLAGENGFHIELLKYIGGVNEGVPERFCLDGREWVGMIATKVKSV